MILLAVVLLAVLTFLPGLNGYKMLDPTDSFFIEAAREMGECHNYVITLANYTEWYEKPVLFLWLCTASYKLFGVSAWAARLPAALSGIILVVATYLFAIRRLNKRTAILSAVILCTSPLFSIVGHVALTDELLSMLLGMAMLYVSQSIITSKQKTNLIAYVFLALAVLCKGPIALVLAFGSVVLYLSVVSDSLKMAKESFFRLRPIAGLIIILCLCLPYFFFAHIATHGLFTEQFFMRQNLGRLQGTVNHQEPLWFYFPVFFAGYFPWCLYFLMAMPWIRRFLSFRLKFTERQKFITFNFCWFVFVAVLFFIVPTKLYTYIVPFSPAFAIVTAAYLDVWAQAKLTDSTKNSTHSIKQKENLLIVLPPSLSFAGSLIMFFVLLALKILQGPVLVVVSTGLIITAIFSLRSGWMFWVGRYNKALVNLSLASIIACATLIPAFFRWFYETHQVILEKAITLVAERNGNLATLFSPVPSTSFYLKHRVPTIESLSQLRQFCKSGRSPHFLLASSNCKKIPELQVDKHTVLTNGKWYLLIVEGFPWNN